MGTTTQDIRAAISELQLAHKTLFIHGAIKSFGQLEGGAETLIDELIKVGCTLVMPAFTWDTICTPPVGWQRAQNGFGEQGYQSAQPLIGFNPDDNRIEPVMGLIPRILLNYPNRKRSQHPLSSFTALGPKAEAILAQQSHLDIYGLYKDLSDEALVITMGVDLRAVTPIHYAEERAGRSIFHLWCQLDNVDQEKVEVAAGGCSNGFHQLAPYVKDISQQQLVGESLWTLYPLNKLVQKATETLIEQPQLSHCPDEACSRCNDIIASQVDMALS